MSTPKMDIYAGVHYVYNQDLISTSSSSFGEFDTVVRPFGEFDTVVRPFRKFDTVAHPFGEFDFNAFVAGVRVDPSRR